jgi:RNA polymerase sigma factor (sigma-70 family)
MTGESDVATMDPDTRLLERFEEHRGRLNSVAYRMLGSRSDAEDAIQEAWIRFSRADTSDVVNLGAWLTTVVSRVCLNMLESRRSRPETDVGTYITETPDKAPGTDPEQQAVLADSVGLALLVVLDTLTPAERVALVLHDMFGLSFDNVALIIGRSETATRQLASRARRRVRGRDAGDSDDEPIGKTDRVRQARVVDAFLSAARNGDLDALIAVLDPDVVLSPDAAAIELGAPSASGARAVGAFLGRARGALAVFVDGVPGAAWLPGGEPRVVFKFTIDETDEKIVAVDLVGDPDAISRLDLVVADDPERISWAMAQGAGQTKASKPPET